MEIYVEFCEKSRKKMCFKKFDIVNANTRVFCASECQSNTILCVPYAVRLNVTTI